VKGIWCAAVLVSWAAAAGARSPAPLYDPVSLNIGLSCQWQQRCIADQTKAMKRALKYVKNKQPPSWRIHRCNSNASRKNNRVDWVGFDNCIRNASVTPLPTRALKKHSRPVTEREVSSRSLGERGH
jgi:hypothetical protein